MKRVLALILIASFLLTALSAVSMARPRPHPPYPPHNPPYHPPHNPPYHPPYNPPYHPPYNPPYHPPQPRPATFLIESRLVGHDLDQDSIYVGSRFGWIDGLEFYVRGNEIRMFDMDVYFCNGGHQDFTLSEYFYPGMKSRLLDLRGNDRCVESVVFNYRTIGYGPRAQIDLYGIRY